MEDRTDFRADINNLINGLREEKVTEKRNQNLMLVYAVEGYAKKHGISERETLSLFNKNGIPQRICSDYNVRYIEHTNLDENVTYAEDIIEGRIPQGDAK